MNLNVRHTHTQSQQWKCVHIYMLWVKVTAQMQPHARFLAANRRLTSGKYNAVTASRSGRASSDLTVPSDCSFWLFLLTLLCDCSFWLFLLLVPSDSSVWLFLLTVPSYSSIWLFCSFWVFKMFLVFFQWSWRSMKNLSLSRLRQSSFFWRSETEKPAKKLWGAPSFN